MKRFLIVFSVLALVISMAASVFAASTKLTDVEGTKYAEAVNALISRGVVNGYLDKTFRPENEISRAEMAKMLVTAAKLNVDANSNKEKEIFPDVTKEHWALSYINAAYKNDYIEGHDDGTFAPDEDVTYAEAITMVVRMLGYKSAVEAKGTWPDNYIKKAESLKLTNNISYENKNDAANRGDVAILVWNALNESKTYYKAGVLEDVNQNGLDDDATVRFDGEDYIFKAKDNKNVAIDKYVDGVVFYKLKQELDEGNVTFESGITVDTLIADDFDDYVEAAEDGKVLFKNRGVESFRDTFEDDFDDYIFIKFEFDAEEKEATNISLVATHDKVKANDFDEFDRIYIDEKAEIVYIVSGLEEKVMLPR